MLRHESLSASLAAVLAGKLANSDYSRREWERLLRGALDRVDGALPREDLRAVVERDPACCDALHCLLHFKGFLGLQLYRCGRALWLDGAKRSAYLCQSRGSEVFGMDLHPAAVVGKGCMIDHATGVVVGETARVGDRCSLLHGVTLGGTGKEHGDRHPKLGDNVLVGAHAAILGNVTVGARSKIGCGSVVLADIPSGATAVGVPAKIVGRSRDGAAESDTALLRVHPLTDDGDDNFRSIWKDRLAVLSLEGYVTPRQFHARLPHLTRAAADRLFFQMDRDVRGFIEEADLAKHFHKFALSDEAKSPPRQTKKAPDSPISGMVTPTVASVFDGPSAPDWALLNNSTWHPGVAVNPLEGDDLALTPSPSPSAFGGGPRRDSRRSLAGAFERPEDDVPPT